MALFRRRTREKEGATDERPETTAPPAPATRPREPSPAPPPTPDRAAPRGSGVPPPLPHPAPGGSAPAPSTEKSTRCFVCRSPLEAGACPVCKITWVE